MLYVLYDIIESAIEYVWWISFALGCDQAMALDQCPKETCDGQGEAPCCKAFPWSIYMFLFLCDFANIVNSIHMLQTCMYIPIYMYINRPPYVAEASQNLTWMAHASRALLYFTCVSHLLTRIEVQPYTSHRKLLSLEILRSPERIWRSLKEANLLNEAELRSSERAPKIPTFHGGLWMAMACANLQCGNGSWKIGNHSARLSVKLRFFLCILSSSRKQKIWGFSSPWPNWPELRPGASTYLYRIKCVLEVLPRLQLLVVRFGFGSHCFIMLNYV